MSIRNKPRDAAVFGIDIGKTVFHVVGRRHPSLLLLQDRDDLL